MLGETFVRCFQKILAMRNDHIDYYVSESYVWEHYYDWHYIVSTLDYLNFNKINDKHTEANDDAFMDIDPIKSKIIVGYEDIEYTMNFLQFHFLIQESEPNGHVGYYDIEIRALCSIDHAIKNKITDAYNLFNDISIPKDVQLEYFRKFRHHNFDIVNKIYYYIMREKCCTYQNIANHVHIPDVVFVKECINKLISRENIKYDGSHYIFFAY